MNGVTYNPDAAENKMTEVTDGVYEITYTDVERWDNYQFKFTANGDGIPRGEQMRMMPQKLTFWR